nr:hypothetical protein GCM10020093_042040 [Planobispora longispora]
MATGIVERGSLCVLEHGRPGGALAVHAYGPEGPELAADLITHLRDWDIAGRPGSGDLRIEAHPAGRGPLSPAHRFSTSVTPGSSCAGRGSPAMIVR